MFLERIEMIFMEPCVADAESVRMFARMSRNIADLMPYLNTVIINASYNKDGEILCFAKGRRLITLYPEKIALAKAYNPTDAWQIMDWIKDVINKTHENQDSIQPNYQRHAGVTALDIFEFLPRLNCGECGEPTCLALAVKLLLDERRIEECKPLFTDEYSRLRKVALDLVSALGYELPEFYNSIIE